MHAKNEFTVFIVDDDPFYAALLEQYLTAQDYTTHLFEGSEALMPELHRCPDMILLDYYLGISPNGLKTLRAIKNINAAIPVVLLSGQQCIEVVVNSLQYGAFDYIEKNSDTFAQLDRAFEKIKQSQQLAS